MIKNSLLILLIFSLTGCGVPLISSYKYNQDKARVDYIANHKLSKKMEDKILSGQVSIGMTKEEVIASWGQPVRKFTTVTKYGEHQQWVYSYANGGQFMYFDNGLLTAWQV